MKNLTKMKRRKFLVHTAIGTAALGLAPLSGLAKSFSSNEIVQLPFAASHIRHGLFSPNIAQPIIIDKVLSVFGKQVFYKNGFEESNDDLINFSFQLNEETMCLSCIGDKVYLNENEFNPEPGVPLRIHQREDREVYSLQGQDLKKEISNAVLEQVVPLCGIFELNGNEIKNDVVIELNDFDRLTSNGSYKLLMIKNT